VPSKRAQVLNAYSKVAKKVLAETLRLKPGETLTIETWTAGIPFAAEAALEAKRLGAFPLITLEDERSYVKGVRLAPKEAIGKMGKHEYGLLSNSDAYLFIPGPPLGGYYPKITRKEFIDSTSYNGSWYEAAKKSRLRGARLTAGYVGNDLARMLGKERDEVVLHQLNAALADFGKIRAKAKKLAGLLRDGVGIALSTEGSELKAKLKGDVEIQDGITTEEDVANGENMSYVPAGYIAKDLDSKSVDGTVQLSPSITRFGLLEDAELKYKKGKFVRWTSKRSPRVLKALEEVIPEKARVPAYVIIGLNPHMRFGYAQDRFPAGSITVGMGIAGIVRKGTLEVGGKTVVREGKLL
jgi:leucyl aminopeptidase (aminopeptidase T)